MSMRANELWNNYVRVYEHMCLMPIRHLGYTPIRCVSCASVAPLSYTKVLFRLCHLDKRKHTNK
jgi:hypothetical protein